jgi:predicted membrane protein
MIIYISIGITFLIIGIILFFIFNRQNSDNIDVMSEKEPNIKQNIKNESAKLNYVTNIVDEEYETDFTQEGNIMGEYIIDMSNKILPQSQVYYPLRQYIPNIAPTPTISSPQTILPISSTR